MPDSDYVKARNKLIPLAVQYANKKEGKRPKPWEGHICYAMRWNRAFLDEMDRLAKESGLSVDLSDYQMVYRI